MKWFLEATGVREHVPVLIADTSVWQRWNGQAEPETSFDALDGVVGVVDVAGRRVVPFGYEGGVFDIGVGKNELVVLQHFDSDEDDKYDELRGALGQAEHDEFLAGEIGVTKGLLIGDSWASGEEIDFKELPAKPAGHHDLLVGQMMCFWSEAPNTADHQGAPRTLADNAFYVIRPGQHPGMKGVLGSIGQTASYP